MILKEVRLTNFGGFSKFTTEVNENFTVLVGPNNGGKSTVIQAVLLCCRAFRDFRDFSFDGDTVTPRPRVVTGVNFSSVTHLTASWLRFDKKMPIRVELAFHSGHGELVFAVSESEKRDGVLRRDVFLNGSRIEEQIQAVAESVADGGSTVGADFVPPFAGIRADESLLNWSQLDSKGSEFSFSNQYRNNIHWLTEGKPPEQQQRVVSAIRDFFPGVSVRPPRRSKTTGNVEIVYSEGASELELTCSGLGLQSLLAIVSFVELSTEQVLLIDEPDAHLHSAVQRQLAVYLEAATFSRTQRQIIVSSHAPDFIEESPVDCVMWVDRSKPNGARCDDVGKSLVDLGAISHTQAVRFRGVDAIVYVEGKLDCKVFGKVMAACGFAELTERIQVSPLKGFGDACHLPGALKILKNQRHKLSMAVILDADYLDADPQGRTRSDGDVFEIRLPCKELENLILMEPDCVHVAIEESANRRRHYEDVTAPSADCVAKKIEELTQCDDVHEALRCNWLASWHAKQSRVSPDSGEIRKAEAEFEKRWADFSWRVKCCPGKLVLKHLRRWLQREYSISVSDHQLASAYKPSQGIVDLMSSLRQHIERGIDGADERHAAT